MKKYLEFMSAEENYMLSFSYATPEGSRGNITLNLNNATEIFTVSDLKKFFKIAEMSKNAFEIAEKFQEFTAARRDYEKSFCDVSRNEKLIKRLESFLVWFRDIYGIETDAEKPEKVKLEKKDGIIMTLNEEGETEAVAVPGWHFLLDGVYYFIHKAYKNFKKRGGYVLTASAYGSRLTAFDTFASKEAAIEWILSHRNISEKILHPETAEAAEREKKLHEKFIESVKAAGLEWITEANPEEYLLTEANPEEIRAAEDPAAMIRTAERQQMKKAVYFYRRVYGTRTAQRIFRAQHTGETRKTAILTTYASKAATIKSPKTIDFLEFWNLAAKSQDFSIINVSNMVFARSPSDLVTWEPPPRGHSKKFAVF